MFCKNMFTKQENEFLSTKRVGRIATVDFDGYPHVVPVCFVFDGISFYTTLSKSSKRLRNIESGCKVSLLVDQYEERGGKWLTLQGLLIKCKVSLLNYYESEGLFMQGWHVLIRKYPQYQQWANEDLTPKDSDKRIIMQMEPIEKISWGFVS